MIHAPGKIFHTLHLDPVGLNLVCKILCKNTTFFFCLSRPASCACNKDEEGLFQGFTPNYLKVKFSETQDLKNKFVDVRLTSLVPTHFMGERLHAMSQ